MTRTPSSRHRPLAEHGIAPDGHAARRRRTRRTIATGIAGLSTLAATLLAASPAAAASSTSSTAIASRADEALEALARWQATADLVDYADYTDARAATATITAAALGVPPVELAKAWAGVSVDKQQVVLAAMSQLGVPYRSQTSREGEGFDCSGLMLFAFGEAGIELPRVSSDQIRAATEVDRSQAEAGDLVYYPGHISLYIGLDLMVHSPQTGEHVEVRALFDRSLRFGDAIDSLDETALEAGVPGDTPGGLAGRPADETVLLVNRAAAVAQ